MEHLKQKQTQFRVQRYYKQRSFDIQMYIYCRPNDLHTELHNVHPQQYPLNIATGIHQAPTGQGLRVHERNKEHETTNNIRDRRLETRRRTKTIHTQQPGRVGDGSQRIQIRVNTTTKIQRYHTQIPASKTDTNPLKYTDCAHDYWNT